MAGSKDPMATRRLLILFLLLLGACQAPLPKGAEAWSLTGEALFPPELSLELLASREQNLAAARQEQSEHQDDRDAAIWVGRRLGYLGRYREAIDVYTRALTRWPDDPFLLRHRGHRYLSVREFASARADFDAAAIACRVTPDEIEPDGLPVPGRPPHSSLHFNVHYHRGLAAFVMGDYSAAERSWLDCLAVCRNDESRVAVSHWLWSARMRCGDVAGASAAVAAITSDMDIVENKSYHQLCLLYGGRLGRAEIHAAEGSSGAALMFGLAHYDFVNGAAESARRLMAQLVLDAGWSSFGVIAAESELARAH